MTLRGQLYTLISEFSRNEAIVEGCGIKSGLTSLSVEFDRLFYECLTLVKWEPMKKKCARLLLIPALFIR